jgi:Met-zincin/RTX calcium-binding nonapeptide repeat (4 copies)/Peptidase M10 serralysin C terminal
MVETRLQLSGNWLAMRSGTTTSIAPTADDAKIIDSATSKLQQPQATTADLELANTSWLVLKDKVSQYSSMVAVVQVAQDDLGSIASYLTQIQQGYDALAGMAEGSQAQADQRDAIAQLELTLSDFIGRRSVTMSDISLISSPTGTFDDAAFKAIDMDASTASTDNDTFAILEVDLAEVLTSTHEASTCPICQAMAAGQKVTTGGAKFDNLGFSAPRSAEAPATNTANVTGATTISTSTASYVEAIRRGAIWNLSAGETLSYSYYTGAVSYNAAVYGGLTHNAPLGASAISAANQAFLDQAFTAWDSAAAFTMEKVTESGTAVGELRSAYTTRTYASAGSAAYAYYPDSTVVGGDIWYIDDQATNLDFSPGGYGYYTALHEIGHALGLSHSFDGTSSAGATLSAANDIARNTVMTYTQYDRNQYWVQNGTSLSARYFYATTPGLYDVAAMEHMYGANSTTNATNTVHQFANWTASSPLYFQTIVDTGGADTLDASAQARSSTINLTPGTFSSVGIFTEAQQEAYWATVLGGAIDIPSTSISSGSGTGVASRTALYTGADNVGIAFSATIENALGGAGADTITGNTANNALEGNAGNDTIDGGTGTDTAVFNGAKANYTISGLGTATVTVTDNVGTDGTDTLTSIEFLEFSDLTVDTSDATGNTTSATAAGGAIAAATAGAAVASSSSSSSSSTSSSSGGGGGGGGAGGFGFDTSTALGKRNFARWRGAYLAEQRAARAAERGDMAEAHLITATKTANVQAESNRQARALSAAIEFATGQKSAVAKLANELYAKSNLMSGNPSAIQSMLASTQSAKQVGSTTANALSSTSAAEKAAMTNISSNLVSSLLG